MNHSPFSTMIADNLARVNDRVASAIETAGREADSVCVVGVTKYVDSEMAKCLFDAGCKHLGESRPQMLVDKASELSGSPISWHQIGHLQRNKVGRILPHVGLIHSVDSVRLAQTIDRLAGEQQNRVEILLEVNVSGDVSKHGFEFDELREAVSELSMLKNVSLRGLMCMAGLTSDASETRNQFAALRELREELNSAVPAVHRFTELSMGMSRDFELAIAEGATIVRIGSMLFDGVP